MPNPMIKGIRCCDGGVRSVLYASDSQLLCGLTPSSGSPKTTTHTEVLTLLVGGRLGDIAVIDIRMQRVSHSWIAHESYKIQSLAQDDDGNLISVGSDSTVRFWSTINYSLRRTWANVHSRKNILVFFLIFYYFNNTLALTLTFNTDTKGALSDRRHWYCMCRQIVVLFWIK